MFSDSYVVTCVYNIVLLLSLSYVVYLIVNSQLMHETPTLLLPILVKILNYHVMLTLLVKMPLLVKMSLVE